MVFDHKRGSVTDLRAGRCSRPRRGRTSSHPRCCRLIPTLYSAPDSVFCKSARKCPAKARSACQIRPRFRFIFDHRRPWGSRELPWCGWLHDQTGYGRFEIIDGHPRSPRTAWAGTGTPDIRARQRGSGLLSLHSVIAAGLLTAIGNFEHFPEERPHATSSPEMFR